MKYRLALFIKHKGRRLEKELLRKIQKNMNVSEINSICGV